MKRNLIPLFAAALAVGNLVEQTASAQNVWIGQNNVSATTNWSDTANWSLATSPAGSDILFGDLGAASTAGVVNSVVDASGLGPAGLTFTNMSQNSFYQTVLIPAGITMENIGTLLVGGSSAPTVQTLASFTGDGTFIQSGATLNVQWIGGSGGGSVATLDLSGLNTFVFNNLAGTITVASAPSGSQARGGGVLTLAGVSNNITASTLAVALGTGNGGTGGTLNFGAGTNILNVNTINVAAGKINNGTVKFAGATGGLMIRGSGGTDADRASFTLARRGNTGSGTINGFLQLNGHPVDILAETMTVGQSTANVSGQTVNGLLAFDAGHVDANTMNLAVCSGNSGAIANGIVAVGGGLLTVSNFSFVTQTLGISTGTLTITNGGEVRVSGTFEKTTTGGTANLTLNSGKLSISNALGSAGSPIDNVSLSDSTLTLAAGATANAYATTLTCGGTTNKINVTDIPVIAGYPAQFPLIKYAGTLGGTFNVSVGTLPASAPAFAGYISNNVTDGSIDLVVTGGPMPARTISWSAAINGDWDTTTVNWKFGASSTTYNELDFVRFDDTATGTTAVNLTSTLHPSSITVSNQTKPYGFTGAGSLSGEMGLTKDGASTLYITNSGLNDFTGPLAINAGTVQVGDGNFSGNLGSGDISNDGLLRFNRADDVTVPNTISGSGSVSHTGMGALILSGANSFDGSVTASVGTLRPASGTALGSTNGGTIIASGATLDVNAQNLGAEPVTVSGTGYGAGGAIINSGAQSLNALRYVTLTGDTTISGSGRWDIRGAPSTTDPANAALSTGGHAYKLTKTGANQVSIVGATVDPMLGDIEVQQGIFGLETASTGLGDPTKTLTVQPGASFQLYQLTNHLNKVISLSSDGATPSIINNSGANTIVGPITMIGDCSFNVNGTSLDIAGSLSGGQLTKNGTGALIIDGNATHAGTLLNIGKLVLNGKHSGTLTANFATTLVGTGTNTGFTDLTGALYPGETNVAGTITFAGLTMEFGATVFFDLGASTTVGGAANDLIQVNGDLTVNGNQISINPTGLLQLGVPYRLFNYTGNLIWNSDLFVTGPNNYVFTINTNTPGQVNLVASGGPPIWNGGSASTSNWSDPANWGGTTISSGDSLFFAGSTRLVNNNDTAPDTSYADVQFIPGAGAFVLNGNPISLGGNVVNGSSNPQTINLGLDFTGTHTLDGGNAGLFVSAGVTNTSGVSTLALSGTGTLTNLLGAIDPTSMTNIISVNSNASWTLANNASATPITTPVQLDVLAGTLNFGSGSDAPVLVSTANANNSRVGVTVGAPATLNVNSGTLTLPARLNTGASGNSIATLNVNGGTLNVSLFQGSDGSANAMTTVNINGGALNVFDTAYHQFYVASRGTDVVSVANSGVINCTTLDLSRNAAGNTSGSIGVVNLNSGGLIVCSTVGTATSSSQSGPPSSGVQPSATFNFNGGTLMPRGNSTTFFQGHTTAPIIPITTIVQSGGAIIDTTNFNITVGEPLQHDSNLGATKDGGLTKIGNGVLTLSAASTYTGNTAVGAGTLLVSGSLGATDVTVSNSATLAGTGTIGGNVTVLSGGTLSPGTSGTIGKLTVSGAVTLQGTNLFELNKSLSPAATNDQLAATGAITFGGTLKLVNLGGTLQVGDAFKLFTSSGGMSGSFTIESSGSVTWDTSTLTSDGTIRVLTSVNQTPTNITASVSGNVLTLNWPADHTGWRLQAQTNSITTGLSGNWVDVPNSQNVNSMNFTINPANGTVFFRMVYP